VGKNFAVRWQFCMGYSTWGLNQRYWPGLKRFDVKVLQWNAMLWDIPHSKHSNVIPSIYRSCIKISIKQVNTFVLNPKWARTLPFFGNFSWNIYRAIPFTKISKYQSWHLTPCCGFELQNPTQAFKSVKGPGNTL
jgi:hypothetical protein